MTSSLDLWEFIPYFVVIWLFFPLMELVGLFMSDSPLSEGKILWAALRGFSSSSFMTLFLIAQHAYAQKLITLGSFIMLFCMTVLIAMGTNWWLSRR
jgi:hypothetical protein